jgi:hypothetical protein
MYVLKQFPPAEAILPESFIAGSRADLELITRTFCEAYNADVGVEYAEEWINFRDNIAPQSDSVDEYVRNHPLHIPFHDTLVRGAPICVKNAEEAGGHTLPPLPRNRPRKSRPLDYVQWSRRGEQKKATDPSSLLPNVVVEGPPGIERYSVPVHCKSSKVSVFDTIPSSGVRLPPLIATNKDDAIDVKEVDAIASGDYENEQDSESDLDETDNDNEINGWMTCRGIYNIPLYGCARDCVGNTFTIPNKFISKAFFGSKCPSGKIYSIVRKSGAETGDVYFKFYNHVMFPEEPPPEDSDEYCFVRCVEFMSSNINRRMMEWDKKSPVKKAAPREKRSHWQMEVVGPALFDQKHDVDVSSGRKLRSGCVIDSTTTEIIEEPPSSHVTVTTATAMPVSSTLPRTRSSVQQTTLPPIHVQREQLRQKVHQSLANKGYRKPTEHVELSDLSSSESDNSDSDAST